VAAYRRLHTTGLPLIAPWANRLAARTYRSGRVRVDLAGLDLHTDENGLPIHGTLTARQAWDVDELSARGKVARLRATFEYSEPELLAAFPFPHRLEALIEVDGRSLSIETGLRPTADRPVPVSFGYHPYLRLPGGRRATWRLHLPERVAVSLDESGIPTGRQVEAPAEGEPIGARTFDDLFALKDGRTLAVESGGRRLSVLFGLGYSHAQVYAPPGADFVCLEPMTAPTNALVSGECPVVQPGESFRTRFSIRRE
jgi:aldose 1-epimerase